MRWDRVYLEFRAERDGEEEYAQWSQCTRHTAFVYVYYMHNTCRYATHIHVYPPTKMNEKEEEVNRNQRLGPHWPIASYIIYHSLEEWWCLSMRFFYFGSQHENHIVDYEDDALSFMHIRACSMNNHVNNNNICMLIMHLRAYCRHWRARTHQSPPL